MYKIIHIHESIRLVPASVDLSHHGQLSLQLLDAVFLEVELGAQHPRVLRGLLGLPPQVPLLPLQQVFLLGQHLHCILALLQHRQAPSRSSTEFSWTANLDEIHYKPNLHDEKKKKKQCFKEAKFGRVN